MLLLSYYCGGSGGSLLLLLVVVVVVIVDSDRIRFDTSLLYYSAEGLGRVVGLFGVRWGGAEGSSVV